MATLPEMFIVKKTDESKIKVTYEITEPITNADRIRSMTDEELAKWLNEFGDPYYCPADNGRWIDWLKQECE